MGLGGSIALIAIGLILAFAVNFTIAGIDVHLIGLILAAVGVLGLVLYFVIWAPRRRSVQTTVRRDAYGDGYVDPAAPPAAPRRGEYIEEHRSYDDRL